MRSMTLGSASAEGAPCFFATVVAACLATTLAHAGEQVLYVAASSTGANNGSSWADAYIDLQSAMDAAEQSGGAITQIWVASGTYKPSKRTDPEDPRSATFNLIDSVSLYGGFAGFESSLDEREIDANPTILSGDFNGDDLPEFVNYEENARHVVTAINIGKGTAFNGFVVTSGYGWGSDYLADRGGGMYIKNSSFHVQGCAFTRNLAGSFGGGGVSVFLEFDEEPSSGVTFSGCLFTENKTVGSGAGLHGTGDYGWGELLLSDCVFRRNVAGEGGGAIGLESWGQASVRSSVFSENHSGFRGGAVLVFGFYDSGTLIDDCAFVENTADGGGALSVDRSDLSILGSRFERNEAGEAGALLVTGGRAAIADSIFSHNFSTGNAGAVALFANEVEIRDCEFSWNIGEYGGGAYLHAYPSGAVIMRSRFWNNKASFSGGGLLSTEPLNVCDSDFQYNRAAVGGGLDLHGHEAIIQGSHFGANNASQGGGIAASSGSVGMIESTLDGNWASAGGGLWINASATASLDRCKVTGNSALVGGGVAALLTRAEARIANSLIALNDARGYGGGIAAGPGVLLVENCTVASNSAAGLGAGLIVGRDTTILNSIVWGNVVDPYGGRWTDETSQIEGIEFAAIDYSDVQGWSGAYGGEGNMGVDPLIVSPIADFRLQPESPCINAGDPEFVAQAGEKDLDGHGRVLCRLVDIGAYEFGIGDYDCDRVVDLEDFAWWDLCMSGPAGATSERQVTSRTADTAEAQHGSRTADTAVAHVESMTLGNVADSPTPIYPPPCNRFDFDADGDVDLVDFAGMQRVLVISSE